MRVVVVGASGRTGRLVVDELLKRGNRVTALVRNLSSFEARDGLTLVQGTPTEKADVRRAFDEADVNGKPDVVVVTLSAPRASDSPFAEVISPPRLMADSNANIVAAMKETGVAKIVIMQAFGVGDSWCHMNFAMRLLMRKSNMIYQYHDHNLVDKEVRESGVNFVMVRPCRLTEGDAKPVREWKEDGKGVPLLASITRQSAAVWLANAAERNTWDNKAPVISN